MNKSKLIVRRKKATILVSKRTVEDALRRANNLASTWMDIDPNDPRIEQLQNVVDHLSSILTKSPQDMRAEGMTSIEDYFDDAKNREGATALKREVNQIAKWHGEQRNNTSQPAQVTPEQQGVSYAPDSAVVMSSEENSMAATDKKANAGGAFVTDRDEKGEPKAPEKAEVPRLAAKKKKEAIPEEPMAAVPPVSPVPPTPPASAGGVNPIEYIPTETLIKVIGDLPKEDDFGQNKGKQDALVALTEILKSRPIEPVEQPEAAAPAPAAPIPAIASKKKADGVDVPAKAKVDLGGLVVAGAEEYQLHDYKLLDDGFVPRGQMPSADDQANFMHPEDEEADKTADGYQLHDYKLQEDGLVPKGGFPSADEQANRMHEEEEGEFDKVSEDYRLHDYKLDSEGLVPTGRKPGMDEQESRMRPEEDDEYGAQFASLRKAVAVVAAAVEKLASGAAGGAWSTDINEKGKVVEDGGRTPEVGEAHGMLDEAPAKLDRPATTAPIKLAADNLANQIKQIREILENQNLAPENPSEILNKIKWVLEPRTGFGDTLERENSDRYPQTGYGDLLKKEQNRDNSKLPSPTGSKRAADMTTSKALKQSESLGNDLKKLYLEAKSLTQVNDTRPVREAVEAIFRAADMFDEATKAFNKQDQQEKNEEEAAEIKAKNKKSSFAGLTLAAASE